MLFSTRDGLAGSQQQFSMDGGWDIAVSADWLTWLADPQK